MAAWTLLTIPIFGIGEWLAGATQAAMLLGAGWPMDRMALVQSLATTVQVVAVVVTGAAITRYGRWRPAVALGLLGVTAMAALLPLAAGYGGVGWTTAALVALSIVYGSRTTWISTVTMDLARKSSAATDYSVPMSIEGICVTVAGSAGLKLAAAVGFPGSSARPSSSASSARPTPP